MQIKSFKRQQCCQVLAPGILRPPPEPSRSRSRPLSGPLWKAVRRVGVFSLTSLFSQTQVPLSGTEQGSLGCPLQPT